MRAETGAAMLAVLVMAGCEFQSGSNASYAGRCPGDLIADAGAAGHVAGTASVRLRFVHAAGGDSLAFDTAAYRTPSGNAFSVERLQYYISGFHLLGLDGDTLFAGDSVLYVDARDPGTWVHVLRSVPIGHVHSYGFTFGLPSEGNRTGSLPNTLENLGMAWPEPMGGGYHFMKLEGRLLDSLSRPYGYYIHVGNPGESADNAFPFREDRFPLHASLAEGLVLDIVIAMDALEWLSGVAPYPLEEKAQGAMDDSAAQELLRRNGASGVFRTSEAEVGHADCR